MKFTNTTTYAVVLQTVRRFTRETRRRYAAPKSNTFTLICSHLLLAFMKRPVVTICLPAGQL